MDFKINKLNNQNLKLTGSRREREKKNQLTLHLLLIILQVPKALFILCHLPLPPMDDLY